MVKFATENDLEQVNIIRKQVNDLHVNGASSVFKPGFSNEVRQYAKQFINCDDKFLIVCQQDNVICSYAMVSIVVKPETPYRYQLKYLEIEEIGTLKQHQGKGYAKQIMQQIKNLATQHNIHKIELNMWNFNKNALKFYKKMGFTAYKTYLELFC